jgi:hypothetical protein
MFRRSLFVCAALALMALAWPGPALADPPSPPGVWVPLASGLRVTYYGPRYTGGEVTASGIRYAPDADIVATSPDLLSRVRAHYANQAESLGQSLWWTWAPGPQLRFGGIAGGFPRHACFACEPDWWGYLVRVCDLETERCALLRLADTGSPALEVDLPDETWERFGYPASQGVFTGTLEVLSFEFRVPGQLETRNP